MSHAPIDTYFAPHGDSSIRGCFTHKDHNTFFEFSTAPADEQFFGDYYDSKVWVHAVPDTAGAYRLARVKKTVAYVIVDEDENGNPVVEKWMLKKFQSYINPRV